MGMVRIVNTVIMPGNKKIVTLVWQQEKMNDVCIPHIYVIEQTTQIVAIFNHVLIYMKVSILKIVIKDPISMIARKQIIVFIVNRVMDAHS